MLARFWLIFPFWQHPLCRMHPLEKMVPKPFQPHGASSSP